MALQIFELEPLKKLICSNKPRQTFSHFYFIIISCTLCDHETDLVLDVEGPASNSHGAPGLFHDDTELC